MELCLIVLDTLHQDNTNISPFIKMPYAESDLFVLEKCAVDHISKPKQA